MKWTIDWMNEINLWSIGHHALKNQNSLVLGLNIHLRLENNWLTIKSIAQVYEAVVSPGGAIDTARIYNILLTSQLSREALGRLWQMANKEKLGHLTQRELYILLALIAVAQVLYKNFYLWKRQCNNSW